MSHPLDLGDRPLNSDGAEYPNPPNQRNMAEGDDAPRTRRERGVQAQREYRKRQATKAKASQEEIASLKNSIENISKALAQDGSLTPELIQAIRDATDVAGVPGPDNVIAPEAADESGHDAIRDAPVTDIAGSPSTLTVPAEKPIGPPIGTFAWCIYWRALYYQVSVFDYDGCPPLSVIAQNAAQVDLAIQLALPLGHDEILDRLWSRRLRFKKFGARQAEVFARYQSRGASAEQVKDRAREEYGELQTFWRSAEAIEKIILSVLNDDEREDFQAAMHGHGDPVMVECVIEIIESMAQNYFCMGKGPVWSCLWAHMGIGAWVGRLRAQNRDATES